MRLDPTAGETAADLVNTLSERDLADVICEYGEERHSRRVARRIVERRQGEAVRDDRATWPTWCGGACRGRGGIDPATRVFQALRIAVNDELGALDRLLAALPRVVKPGGRAGIISFHSLEDRRVKQAFRDRRRLGAGDEEAGRGGRRGSGPQPAGPQRQAAGGGAHCNRRRGPTDERTDRGR